jgi:hypothetical protein
MNARNGMKKMNVAGIIILALLLLTVTGLTRFAISGEESTPSAITHAVFAENASTTT